MLRHWVYRGFRGLFFSATGSLERFYVGNGVLYLVIGSLGSTDSNRYFSGISNRFVYKGFVGCFECYLYYGCHRPASLLCTNLKRQNDHKAPIATELLPKDEKGTAEQGNRVDRVALFVLLSSKKLRIRLRV